MKNIPRFIPSLTIKDMGTAFFAPRKGGECRDPLIDFAKQFAEYIGVSYAIPAPSARGALKGILHALALPGGGEVILPSLVFHCIPSIFLEFGLKLRFVDIDPKTQCIDIDRIESAVTSTTVAIFPVHLYGRACNMEKIKAIADRYGLVIIEDCAQSCGTYYSGKRVGSFGQAAIFSFSPHKNLSVLGMGMAVTGSYDLAVKIGSWLEQKPRIGNVALTKKIFYSAGMRLVTRPWFWDPIMTTILKLFDSRGIDLIEVLTNESSHTHTVAQRISSCMPKSLYGKIGMLQLKKLDALNRMRIHNGNKLYEYLQGLFGIELPAPARFGENIFSTFVIRVNNRPRFRNRLRRLGVDTHGGDMSVGPCLLGAKSLTEAENAFDAAKRIVHLPIYPQMRESDLLRVAQAIKIVLRDQVKQG